VTAEFYSLSLHDALPILLLLAKWLVDTAWLLIAGPIEPPPSTESLLRVEQITHEETAAVSALRFQQWLFFGEPKATEETAQPLRSEEHTSELQSRFDLVC